MCCAYYFLERGFSVTLIEKSDVGAGSSYGNGGLIVPSHAVPLAAPGVWRQGLKWMFSPTSPLYIKPRPDPALVRWLLRFLAASDRRRLAPAITALAQLSHASRALFEQLATLDGVSFGYQHKGGLALFRSEEALEKGAEEAHLLLEHGVETRVLGKAEVRTIEPVLDESVVGGVYFPPDAHVIPHEFVQQLARVVEARGGVIQRRTEVTRFELDGDRIVAVHTPAGKIAPREVVLASGAWSPKVALDLKLSLPVQPAKGYSITVEMPANAPATPLHLSEIKVVVTPMGKKVRFAGTLELAGFSLAINQRRVEAIKQGIPKYLPLEIDYEDAEVWSGLRPLTPDTLPIVGRTRRCKNLILATGHGMLGVSLAPITGQLVAELAAGAAPSHDLALLTPDRF